MAFIKFNIADNASAQLDAWISASTTTIVLKTWEGSSFPAWNFIGTLVQYTTPSDPTTPVAKREKVLCSVRSTDTLTVTRGYDWDTWTTFDADDYFYLNVTSKVIEDIQDEVTRLESDKLDAAWALRTWLTGDRLIYTDSSGNEIGLALWSANEYLKVNGAWTALEFWVPPLDIDWQTQENGALQAADQIVFYDNSALANRKRNAKASTTVEWLMEIATDSEVVARTDTERAVTPAWLTAWLKDQVQTLASKSLWSNIQATENGFVHWYTTRASWTWDLWALVYSDASTTPSTLIYANSLDSWSWDYAWFCVPIKKGNYYRVDWVWHTWSAVYFTPLS